MKKVLAFLLVLILCLSFSGVALAKSSDLSVTDDNGNPVNWIHFKLHPTYDLTKEVDTVWVIPIYDEYIKDQLYAAAQEAYPGATVNELGRINMSGWDTQYEYIFDYYGPFTAQVDNPDVHNGDKVVVFISHANEEQPIEQVKAFRVKDGTFSFRDFTTDAMEANCVYVILH